MSSPDVARPSVIDRHARGAVAALFLTNGALFANLLPRYPEVKESLHLGASAYGLAVAAFPMGAILAGLGAATLIRRFGSARVAVAGTVLTALGVLGAGSAPAVWMLALFLFVGGAMDAVTDVAQNAHGLRVQRRYGRSILNSFHAMWSIGAVLGGTMAAIAIAMDVPLPVHLVISAVVFSTVSLVALRYCLAGPDDESASTTAPDAVGAATRLPQRMRPHTGLIVAALVLIATAGAVVEDAGNTWATLYLSESLHASASLAAAGYISLAGAMLIGRLVGDRVVDRFGQRAVARGGGLLVAFGMGTALAFPSIVATLIGFACAGLGVATLVPAAMHAADELPGLRPGTGLTIVSWLMRLGFLLSPPIVGLIADHAGLRYGLLSIPLAGVVVVALSGVLSGRQQAPAVESPEHRATTPIG